ncbi:MAG: hypothetical protein IK058_03940 [Bacteroidales bacterium]|nr:hypothetical protein [Bacteroidales bacterium]
MTTINDTNYELWLVRYADGALTAAERETVETWLQSHPEAAEELALYTEAPRLERDEEVKYAATVLPQTRPLWPAGWRWVAAAAVALLILVPVALRVAMPHEEGQQVATLRPTVLLAVAEPDSTATTPAAAPATKPAVRRPADTPLESQRDLEPVEDFIPSRPMAVEPLLLAEELPVEEPVDVEPSLIYVDNLFAVDSGNAIQQRLLLVNDAAKERLQGTYLGRRLARRLPSNDELLDYTDGLRERTPQGVRMVTDMVLAYNDSNK